LADVIIKIDGNLQGALEAYKKSLEIEWNQPPVMEARKRMERQVEEGK
jgi:hypothetical protein